MKNRDMVRRLVLHSLTGLPNHNNAYMHYVGTGANGFASSSNALSSRKDYRSGDVFKSDFGFTRYDEGVTASRHIRVVSETDDFVVYANTAFSLSDLETQSTFDTFVGLSRTLVVPNIYLNYMADPKQQDRYTQSLYAVRLDPPVFITTLDGPFPGNEAIHAEVCLSSKFVHGRSNAFEGNPDTAYELSRVLTSGAPGNLSLDPYRMVQGHENYPASRLYVTASNMDFDSNSTPVRFAGRVYGSWGDFSGTDVDLDLLRIDYRYNQMEPFQIAPCYMLVLSHPQSWMHSPLAVYKSSPTAKVSGPFKANYVSRSFHRVGFTPTTDINVQSVSRSDKTIATCVTFTKRGTTTVGDQARYVIEKRLHNIVNGTLTSHLPFYDSYGKQTKYFGPKGTFIGANAESYQSPNRYACLQPVAFPWCQQLNSDWIYFVSMDDDYSYHLNRYRIGMLNTAECVLELTTPPLEMLAVNNIVYMAYGDGVRTYNHLTNVDSYLTTDEGLLSNNVTAIAFDEISQKLWFGHLEGLTDFTSQVTYDASFFVNSTSEQIEVSAQSLTALNNRLTWTGRRNNYYGANDDFADTWVSMVDVNTGNYQHFNWTDLCEVQAYTTNSYNYVASLRSNGQLVVIRDTENSANRIVGFFTYDVKLVGKNVGNSWKVYLASDKANFNLDFENASGYFTYRFVKLIRVCDSKYVTGIIPNNNKASYPFNSPSAQMRNIGTGARNPGAYREFYIADEKMRLDFDPYYTNTRQYNIEPGSVKNGVNEATDPVNFFDFAGAMYPWNSLSVRDIDYDHCARSFGIVRYGNAFAPMFAGYHIAGHGGVPLSWSGSAWVPQSYGAPVSKPVHETYESVDPYVSIQFKSGVTYGTGDVFRVDCMPSSSNAMDIRSYVGDYVEASHTVVLSQPSFVAPESLEIDFQGVDFERLCIVTRNATTLSRIASGVPSPGQYLCSKAGAFTLNPADIGQVNFNYLVVKAVL